VGAHQDAGTGEKTRAEKSEWRQGHWKAFDVEPEGASPACRSRFRLTRALKLQGKAGRSA